MAPITAEELERRGIETDDSRIKRIGDGKVQRISNAHYAAILDPALKAFGVEKGDEFTEYADFENGIVIFTFDDE
ncbi:hypothetical protein [Natrarchaeobaculum aegyptiacum]|uniref:Uncharacterized protein n=1 Tax=Natrarchaeobaculum aegyptiacum TaxID=745377 RepID=A0A2Z2I0X6_9EURY|nr:hypothetical protein [Natrarchaeobaculum aegyptiacum]ARS89928.1 hypothetical protein B1756_09430 [Natrarchaeobaculum aegyptiacum]